MEIDHNYTDTYQIIQRIGDASVNSEVFLVQRDNQKYALKKTVVNQDMVFWNNKLLVYKKLKKLTQLHDCFILAMEYGTQKSGNVLIGYVVEPFLDGYVSFETYCIEMFKQHKKKETYKKLINTVFNNVITIIKRLHDVRFNHNDLHTRNIMVHTKTGDVKIIDYDWCIIHDKRKTALDAHKLLLMLKYFYPIKEIIQMIKIDLQVCETIDNCMESYLDLALKTFEHSSKDECNKKFYSLHLLYSLEYYLKGKYSPKIDCAMFCTDFAQKFIGVGNCGNYITDFKVTPPELQTIQEIRTCLEPLFKDRLVEYRYEQYSIDKIIMY